MLHVYKASAGSGKTYTLTKQYLMLMLGNRNPTTGEWTLRKAPDGANRHILAITFTNKATEEMIKRIISELAILAQREPEHPDPSDYLADFLKIFHTDEPTLRELASATLDDLLADYVYFNVSTIDSFFQNVLRIFAREVEMPDDFELELDNNYTISLGVSHILQSINLGPNSDPLKKRELEWLEKWLNQFVISNFDNGAVVNLFSRTSSLFSELVDTFKNQMNETFKLNIEPISNYLADLARLDAFQRAILKDVGARKKYIAETADKILQYSDICYVNSNLTKYIKNCAQGDIREPKKTVRAAVNDYKSRFLKSFYSKHDVPADLDALIAELCASAVAFSDVAVRNKVVLKAINTFGLLGCLLNVIAEYCKDNNRILLSETNSLLRSIINDDDTPFVYERLGYYLHHFLIDEFQDTSRMQWENLRPLLMESLSHNHENLIIGDEKQCIYRFRNSDPELLGHEIGSEVLRVYNDDYLSVEGCTVEQNNNWRSSHEVVTFNNSVFRAMATLIGDRDTFANVVQQISSKRTKIVPGYVKVLFEEKPTDDDPDAENEAENASTDASPNTPNTSGPRIRQNAADADADTESDGYYSQFALDSMVEEINRQLASGYSPGDIAVLVRTHGEGEAVIRRLMQAVASPEWSHGEIEITSADAVGISASAAVKMVIRILRLTQLPRTVMVKRSRADGTTECSEEENPSYRRSRLMYCMEYLRHEPITAPDGSVTYRSNNEALREAIETLRNERPGDGSPFSAEQIVQMLKFNNDSNGDAGDESHRNDVVCATLSTVVDNILSRFISPAMLRDEAVYITAFQDLVYDFCARGNSDIRSFLDWWDRSGYKSALSTTDETRALTVMTIHQSKGLEFPCVIIPFANWDFVKDESRFHLIEWFKLDSADFPEVNPDLLPPMLPLSFSKKLVDIPIFANQAEIYVRQKRVDSLNLTYVAFTRAVNELIVIAPYKNGCDKGVERDNLYVYLKQAIEDLNSEAVNNPDLFDDQARPWALPLAEAFSGTVLEIGKPTVAKKDTKDKVVAQSKALPAYNPTVNTSLTTFTKAVDRRFDFNDPRKRGDFLHRILSKVMRRDDLPIAVRRAVSRVRITAEQTRQIEQTLAEALSNPQVEPWFDGFIRSVNERTIVTDRDDYRPDRIVWTADGHIDVVDFKFGAEHGGYRRQVSNYAQLLRDAGYDNVRAFLWYVTSGKICRVV